MSVNIYVSVYDSVISYHSLIKVTLLAKGYLVLQDLVWSLPLSLTWFLSTLGLLHSAVAIMDFSYFFGMPSTFSSRTCVLAMTSSQNSASQIFPCLISLTHSGLYSTILPRGSSLSITCKDNLHLPPWNSSLFCALLPFTLLPWSVTDLSMYVLSDSLIRM